MNLTLFDYGVGNLHSLRKAFENAGAAVTVTDDPAATLKAQALLLPGVGAFGKVAERLASVREELRRRMEDGLPVFAVCVGMQALYESSEESPGSGIGLLPGVVRRLDHTRLPHIGWNTVEHPDADLFRGIPAAMHFYFVHSYAPSPCTEFTVATAQYGRPFAAAVRRRNVWGVQFHPEKSGDAGRRLVSNFLSFATGVLK